MVAPSEKYWTWDGKLYQTPHIWGSEAISWRSDQTTLDYKTLSYGTLWRDEYKGKVQGRPHSMLTGIGLWLDATGQVPSNRMLDTFENEEKFRKVWDRILAFAVAHKPWIRQFWDSADNTKSGLMENGVAIGQTWDGPAISLRKQGKPVRYMAPQEGAISWIDGWAMPSAAKNVAQAYAWLQYVHSPEASAKAAEGSGYNPIVKGADALLSAQAQGDLPGGLSGRRAAKTLAAPGGAELVSPICAAPTRKNSRRHDGRRRTRPRERPIRRLHRGRGCRHRDRGGRVLLLPRPVGLRQDDDPARDLGLRAARAPAPCASAGATWRASGRTSGRPR